jgi:hypothetical protein
MGGGGGGPGGGGGGGGGPGFGLTLTIGFGISIGAEFAEKIFRPFPEYTSDSVTSIASIRSVGSSCAEVVPNFFATGATFTGAVTTTGAGAGGADGDEN